MSSFKAESRTMGRARFKNRLEQKTLDHKLASLTSNLRNRSNKLATEMGQIQDDVRKMTSVGGKVKVFPKGLSEEEKATYKRQRRRHSMPSMTLQEFDAKITNFRHGLMTYRSQLRRQSLVANLHHAPTFNYVDDVTIHEVDAGIVNLDEYEFSAPFAKHKHAIKNALKKAEGKAEVTSQTDIHVTSTSSRRKSLSSSIISFPLLTGAGSGSADAARKNSKSKEFRPSVSYRPTSAMTGSRYDSLRQVAPQVDDHFFGGKEHKRSTGISKNDANFAKENKRDFVIVPDYVASRRMSMI